MKCTHVLKYDVGCCHDAVLDLLHVVDALGGVHEQVGAGGAAEGPDLLGLVGIHAEVVADVARALS